MLVQKWLFGVLRIAVQQLAAQVAKHCATLLGETSAGLLESASCVQLH